MGDNHFLWSLALPLLTQSRKPLAFAAAKVTAGLCSACGASSSRAFSITLPQARQNQPLQEPGALSFQEQDVAFILFEFHKVGPTIP